MKQVKIGKFNLVLCSFSLLILIIYVYKIDGVENVIKIAQKVNPLWLIAGLCGILLYFYLEAYILHLAVKRLHPLSKFNTIWNVSIIGQYFNCITPFASGGQPAQVYFMVKHGIPIGSSLSALLIKFIVYQFTLTVFSIFVLTVNAKHLLTYPHKATVIFVLILGFLVNSMVIFVLIATAFFKAPAKKIANLFVTFLTKIKLFKNPYSKRKAIAKELRNFYYSSEFIRKNVALLIKMCFLSAIQLTIYFSITYMIYLAFGNPPGNYFNLISSQAYVSLVSAFVPLPGALGGAEGSFSVFLKPYLQENTPYALLFWRLLTFYFSIIFGMIVFIIEKRKISLHKNVDR